MGKRVIETHFIESYRCNDSSLRERFFLYSALRASLLLLGSALVALPALRRRSATSKKARSAESLWLRQAKAVALRDSGLAWLRHAKANRKKRTESLAIIARCCCVVQAMRRICAKMTHFKRAKIGNKIVKNSMLTASANLALRFFPPHSPPTLLCSSSD